MDTTTLMLSLLFGMVGMGFLMYGKNAGQMVPIGAGLCLMICPYFLPSVALMLGICIPLLAAPFVFRGA
ncbi:MAG: hypothetical protein JWL69_2509 [Phycisphaerales bacterium]|nr:hypothetical protein [Phycisphaerales bacterium]MDB5358570.1 hypothetical protein [Phycisphaerales bacterium]